MSEDWHRLANPDEIPSPALLIYPDRVVENIRRMIAMAGTVDRLRLTSRHTNFGRSSNSNQGRHHPVQVRHHRRGGDARTGRRPRCAVANQLVGPNARRLAKLAGWFAKSASPPSPTTPRRLASCQRGTGGRHQAAGFARPRRRHGAHRHPAWPGGCHALPLIDQLPGVEPRATPVRRAPARK